MTIEPLLKFKSERGIASSATSAKLRVKGLALKPLVEQSEFDRRIPSSRDRKPRGS